MNNDLLTLRWLQDQILGRVESGVMTLDYAISKTQEILGSVYFPVVVDSNSPKISSKTHNLQQDTLPSWYVNPKAQIHRVELFLAKFGGEPGFTSADIPPIPKDFVSSHEEVLMLAVYLPDKIGTSGVQRTFEAWWSFFRPHNGCVKDHWDRISSDPTELRLLTGGENRKPGIRWVRFTPGANPGISPNRLWNDDSISQRLAGPEVLMAIAMFPRWAAGWDGSTSLFPNLAGYVATSDDKSESCPYLLHHMTVKTKRRICLAAGLSSMDRDSWCSPVIREC